MSLWPSGDLLYAGLSGGGVWKYPLPEISAVITDEGNILPPFVMGQNYPNPFIFHTTITYTIERPGYIGLRIFDASGRFVRGLVEGEQVSGEHQARWDGRDFRGREMPSGSYFYRLRLDQHEESREMLLLR